MKIQEILLSSIIALGLCGIVTVHDSIQFNKTINICQKADVQIKKTKDEQKANEDAIESLKSKDSLSFFIKEHGMKQTNNIIPIKGE